MRLIVALLLLLCLTADARPFAIIYGLEWTGEGPHRRMLYWDNPFPIYDATYIFRVLPHEKTSGATRYWTTFFWGNNGRFDWDSGDVANTYYGAHPYPGPPANGTQRWEISVYAMDETAASEVDWDRWHVQAFRAWRESASITQHEFYYDLPDLGSKLEFEVDDPAWADMDPPSPAIVMGQAPDYMGASWGGYAGWEEFKGVIRGIQIYSEVLTIEDIQAEIVSPGSTVAGAASLWYLNLNPRPDDVEDKSGNGNHPAWDGVPALEWSEGEADPPSTAHRRRGKIR